MANLNPLGLDDLVDNAIPAIHANFVALNNELATKETPAGSQAKADAAQAAATSAAAVAAALLYSPTSHVHTVSQISDSTTVGRALMTAANAAAARAAMGAGTSSFSGAYADLTGLPSLFDGSWASLSGKPSLFDGTWASLSGKPSLFDGSWASLSGKPTLTYFATGTDAANLTGSIPRALFPAGTGLQVLRLNSAATALEWVTITAGGGDMSKSENLAGLTDYAQARTYLGLGTAALQSSSAFAAAAHNHDATYAPISHTHTASQISDSTTTGRALLTAADAAAARTAIGAGTSSFNGAYGSLTGLPSLFDGTWGSLTGKPSTFTPSAHSHAISDTTGLQDALDTKQAIVTRITQLLALGEGYIKINPDGSLSVDIPAGGVGGTQVTDAEVIAGIATDARLWSAAQGKLAAQTWGAGLGLTTPADTLVLDYSGSVVPRRVVTLAPNSFTISTSGTGAGSNGYLYCDPRSGVAGPAADVFTGTTATGAVRIAWASGTNPGTGRGSFTPSGAGSGGEFIFNQRIVLPIISNGTETFTALVGLLDNLPAANVVSNGVGFRITDTLLECFSASGGVFSVLPWGTAIAASTPVDVTFNWKTGVGLKAWVNGVYLGVLTTNMPSTSSSYRFQQAIFKSAGTTSRELHGSIPTIRIIPTT